MVAISIGYWRFSTPAFEKIDVITANFNANIHQFQAEFQGRQITRQKG
jgi:hypothetical protein